MLTQTPPVLQRVLGFQTWTSWTPTFTAGSGSFTTITVTEAKYVWRGKDIEWVIDFTITDKGSALYDLRFSMPNSAITSAFQMGINPNSGGSTYQSATYGGGSLTYVWLHDNSDPNTTGARIHLRGRYRAVS